MGMYHHGRAGTLLLLFQVFGYFFTDIVTEGFVTIAAQHHSKASVCGSLPVVGDDCSNGKRTVVLFLKYFE
jgi:hypothetical protein